MTEGVVVVGSCVVDLISYSQRLPVPGQTLLGTKFTTGNGGKGANQCVAAARLGAKTALVGSLGADVFGKDYLETTRLENVDVSHLHLREGVHSGVAQISVAENGDNTIVIVPGANMLLSVEDVDAAAHIIKKAAVLLCQFETPLSTTLHALKVHKGHGLSVLNGAPAVENPDPQLLETCDIFCVNETEAAAMTGVAISSVSDAQVAVDKLLSQGCNAVLLTLGSLGATYASKSDRKIIHIPSEPVKPIDTTGAGDAFLGAFAYFRASHRDLSMTESIKRACYVASRSVLKLGTQSSFPKREELPAYLFK